MAVADFTARPTRTIKVEIVSADHQNKPDVGSNIANQWYRRRQGRRDRRRAEFRRRARGQPDRRNKNKVFIVSGAAASDLTGPKCNANTVHWTYDTWMLANGTGKAIVKTGGDTWFFLTADYAFGHALERDTAAVVEKPTAARCSARSAIRSTPTTSRRSCCRRRASKAKVIGLANAGGDTINSIKQAAEFGIVKGGQKLRRPAGVRERRQRARPADRAGPDPDRDLVLGPSTTPTAPGPSAGRRSATRRASSRPWCRPASIPASRTISRRSPR